MRAVEVAIEQQKNDEDAAEDDLASRLADLHRGQEAGQDRDQNGRGGDPDIGSPAPASDMPPITATTILDNT